MNYKMFILMILCSYLSFASGQTQYLNVYSYYGSPNDYQYPSYSVSYYSSYVLPTYYSKDQGLTNTNTTLLNRSTNAPIVQQSSTSISNITNFIDIYTIVFIGMMIDMIMNIM